MTTPTKPLFTARFAIVNTAKYTQDQIMGAFAKDLKAAGYVVYQTPSLRYYTATFKITDEKIDEEDGSKSTFSTMVIDGPSGKQLSIGMNRTLDKPGVRPILEKKLPLVTAVAWNLGPPASAPSTQALADKLWAIRKNRIYNADLYTGIGWTPIVTTWQTAPVKLAPYPDRPPLPASLVPAAPKPVVVAPKPVPVDPYVPPPIVLPPAPAPVQASALPWGAILGGSAALLAFWALSEK